MSDITKTLAGFASGLTYDALPADVAKRAELLIMDHVGIALRARQEAELVPAMTGALTELGLTGGNCTVLGDAAGYTPPAAALVNGNLGHALDFDDTHAPASLHPSAPIVPAAMAAAEMTGADGRTVVAAIVAGYEVQIRLSLALSPSDHYNRGFHPTATCGVFGAAAAAGRVFALTQEQMADAFGLCGSQAAGSMQFLSDGAWNKPYHTGYAAMNGLVSASMARRGFRGASEAIEGKAGFLRAYAPNPRPEVILDQLGERFETMGIAVKPYPSCRYGHAAMDALIELRAANDIDYHDITAVEVGLPQTGFNIIGTPEPMKQQPKNYVDGQFSMPFVGAVALIKGSMGWDDYAVHINDPDTLALCKRIHTRVDERVEAEFPAHMSGVARVQTSRGEYEKLVVVAKGEPDNFVSEAELRAKFDALVSPYLSDERRDALANGLNAISTCDSIKNLLELSRPDTLSAQGRRATGGDE